MIPDEAVEAAAKALWRINQHDDEWVDEFPEYIDFLRAEARKILEAAAPHLRQAFLLEMNLRAVQEELNTPLQSRKATHGND